MNKRYIFNDTNQYMSDYTPITRFTIKTSQPSAPMSAHPVRLTLHVVGGAGQHLVEDVEVPLAAVLTHHTGLLQQEVGDLPAGRLAPGTELNLHILALARKGRDGLKLGGDSGQGVLNVSGNPSLREGWSCSDGG